MHVLLYGTGMYNDNGNIHAQGRTFSKRLGVGVPLFMDRVWIFIRPRRYIQYATVYYSLMHVMSHKISYFLLELCFYVFQICFC